MSGSTAMEDVKVSSKKKRLRDDGASSSSSGARVTKSVKTGQWQRRGELTIRVADLGAHWTERQHSYWDFTLRPDHTAETLAAEIAQHIGVEQVTLYNEDIESFDDDELVEYLVIAPTWQVGIRQRLDASTRLPKELVGLIADFVPEQNTDHKCPRGSMNCLGTNTLCMCQGRCRACYAQTYRLLTPHESQSDYHHTLCHGGDCTCNCRTLTPACRHALRGGMPRIWHYKFSVQPYGVRVALSCSVRTCEGEIDVSGIERDPLASHLIFRSNFMNGHVPLRVIDLEERKVEYVVDGDGLNKFYKERKPLCTACQQRLGIKHL